jgi:hypothetical protein
MGVGILLGALNALVIAIGMGIMANDSEVTTLVIMFGGVPGMIAGGFIGWLARRLATRSPRLRVPLLAALAVSVVCFLAAMFEIYESILVACIPTLTAVLLLERWTRRVTPAPVPIATVRSMRA